MLYLCIGDTSEDMNVVSFDESRHPLIWIDD